MKDKLITIIDKYNHLTEMMTKKEVISNQKKLTSIAKEHRQLNEIVTIAKQYILIYEQIEEYKEILSGNDKDLIEIAKEEKEISEKKIQEIEKTLKFLLLPKDPYDEKNLILEIRAGTGGEEAALFAAATPDTRRIAMRLPMVFGPGRGGVYEAFRNFARLGLGGTQGPGNQYVSWLHVDDLLRIINWCIEHETLEGAINMCAPNPMPNREFLKALRDACGAKLGLPAAIWMLEIGAFFMRTETELLLKSRRVVPGTLLESGFEFNHPTWPEAAQAIEAKR